MKSRVKIYIILYMGVEFFIFFVINAWFLPDSFWSFNLLFVYLSATQILSKPVLRRLVVLARFPCGSVAELRIVVRIVRIYMPE